MADRFNLAVAQGPDGVSGPAQRVDWLAWRLQRLGAQDIDLILLPELFLTGYRVSEKLLEWAEPGDGPAAERIAGLARKHGVAIAYGFPERDDARVFNSAQCFGPDGGLLGRHRKLILPPGFEGDHFSAGTGCNPFRFKGLNIATLICYDAEFPETFRHVAAQGAELVLVPTALGDQWGVVARKMIPTRAFENGVFVAYANHTGTEGNVTYLGESCIIAPDGEELARAGAQEEVITALLEPTRVARAQARLPYRKDRVRIRL